MAFEFTEEQQTLRDTIRRSFADTVTSEFVRDIVEGKNSGDSIWQLVSELGLFEFFADPDGPSLPELMMIAHESGRVLLPHDVAGTLLFGPMLARATPSYASACAFTAEELVKINDGTLKVGTGVLAHGNVDFVSMPNAVRLVCLNAESQTLEVVNPKGAEGAKHAALDLSAPKFRYATSKAHPISDSSVLNAFRILVAAELSGVLCRVVEMTKEYVATRKQFGAPIGSFQAVQQQLSDVYLKSESLLSLVEFASWTFHNSKDQLELSSLSALGYAIDVVPLGVETAIQLHGGIGFTWEYDLHLYLRRARALSSLFALSDREYETVLNQASKTDSIGE